MSAARVIPVIAKGARFDGLLAFEREARVEGELSGRAVGDGHLEIASGARVEGTVEVETLRVEGELEGEVCARSKTSVSRAGRIRGSIETAVLEVTDGASIQGPVTMIAREPA